MITAAQIRAARGLLKWTQATLAARSGLSAVTLNIIESETVTPRKGSLLAIQQALEQGGVGFIVRRRRRHGREVLRGKAASIRSLLMDLYRKYFFRAPGQVSARRV